jgi:FlaA1/EpsC-like NDP-sugar epimerase
VRFGNVLGSRGSVIPTFLKQIAAGGPVMVTHPEMRRYFMTIPEAVQLVLQAYVMGTGDEVFCLDMGEPVKIVDLARDLITLTVTQDGPEIEVRFTGVRPGEKLYEELFFGSEQAEATSHQKVLRSTRTTLRNHMTESLAAVTALLADCPGEAALHGAVHVLVEDYRAP